ncbi:MAG: PilZ domain-containing protein [Pseudomonadales bacterium]
MIQQPAEKRRKTIRYPAVAYRAEVKRLRGVSRFMQPFPAEVIDYHSEGACFCCKEKFRVGDRVILGIFSPSEHVTNIRGVVRHVSSRANDYWFGVEFVGRVRGRPVDQSVLVGLEALMKGRIS